MSSDINVCSDPASSWEKNGGSGSRSMAWVGWAYMAVILGMALALMARLLDAMGRGFDFTDEAFYLLWTAAPSTFDFAFGFFGYALHPIYWLVDESVSGLRRACLLLACAAGLIVGVACVTRHAFARAQLSVRIQFVVVVTVLPVTYYALGIPTPSYNWFALIGALTLVAAIVFLIERSNLLTSAVCGALSLTFALFARPTTVLGFLAIYLLAAMTLTPDIRTGCRQIGSTALMALVIFGVLLLVLPTGTIVRQSIGYVQLFGLQHPSGAGMIESVRAFVDSQTGSLFTGTLLIAIVALHHNLCPRRYRVTVWLLWAAGALLAAQSAATFLGLSFVGYSGISAAIFGYMVVAVIFLLSAGRPDRVPFAMTIAGLAPFAAAIGTNNPLANQLVFYSAIPLSIGMFLCVVAMRGGVILSGIIYALMLGYTHLIITAGFATPYRLATSLDQQVHPVTIGSRSVLKTDAVTANFITALERDAKESGFCEGDNVLDVSGRLPGIAFVLGGRAPVFPWITSGYEFSEPLFRTVMARIPEREFARTWIVDSETTSSFSKDAIRRAGVSFDQHVIVSTQSFPLDGKPVRLYGPQEIVASRATRRRC